MRFASRFVSVVSILLLGIGCANKYHGWQYVRIEQTVPAKECEYIIQEACHREGAECYNWYKKRAVTFGANTVVLTTLQQSQATSGHVLAIGNSAGGNVTSSAALTALADYYRCPARKL